MRYLFLVNIVYGLILLVNLFRPEQLLTRTYFTITQEIELLVFNTTINNISVILCQSVLMMHVGVQAINWFYEKISL